MRPAETPEKKKSAKSQFRGFLPEPDAEDLEPKGRPQAYAAAGAAGAGGGPPQRPAPSSVESGRLPRGGDGSRRNRLGGEGNPASRKRPAQRGGGKPASRKRPPRWGPAQRKDRLGGGQLPEKRALSGENCSPGKKSVRTAPEGAVRTTWNRYRYGIDLFP